MRRHDVTPVTTLGDLTARHQGRKVTITAEDGTTITGPLHTLEVDTDMIPAQEMGEREPRYVRGRSTVTVGIGPWTTHTLDVDTPVTVHP